jgi:ketosteroid isomerase-like protein
MTSTGRSTPASTVGPWYGPRTGKEGVTTFFEAFGATMEVQEFTPRTFAANDTYVLTVVRCRARSKATGKELDMNLHHFFRFQGGKIVYYRGTEDTAQVEAALRA